MFVILDTCSTASSRSLTEAVDALAALDLDELDDASLHELVVATQRLRDRFDVAAGHALARWDHRQVWRNDQSLGARQRLSNETGCSIATAGRRLRRARSLARVPGAAAAVADGRVSIDHLDLLARAETHNPADYAESEQMLVDQCASLRFEQAQRVVDYWINHADPDGTPPDDTDTSSAHAAETADGTVHVTAHLYGLGAHHFHTELDRLANLARLADERAGVTRTAAQRRGAALLEMANAPHPPRRGAGAQAAVHRPARRPHLQRPLRDLHRTAS